MVALPLQEGLAQSVDIAVAGGDSALLARVRTASLTQALGDDDGANSSDFLAAAQADYRRLLRALYEEGYYGGRISIRIDGREAAQITPLAAPTHISRVDIAIEPGRRFTFGKAQITPLPKDADITPDFATGAPARADVLRSARQDAVEAWRAQGHAKAALADSDLTADHRTARLDARLMMAPGPRLRFGPLSVSGTSRVRPDRVRAIAGLPVGPVFDPQEVEDARRRLRRTGVFDAVTFTEAETWGADGRLDMDVRLSDRKPRRIGAGAEYATDDGLSVSAFWLHRNLLGGAERLRLNAKVSNIMVDGNRPNYNAGLSFSRPATFNMDNTFEASLNLSEVNAPSFRLRSLRAYAGISREVNRHFTLRGGLGLDLAEGRDAAGPRNYRLITFPIEAADDRRDDKKDATRGYYLGAKLTPFWGGREIGRGYRFYGDARAYHSFADDRLTLAGRVQLGSLSGVNASQAPLDYTFFSGGGGTVRGQRYQSLGSGDNRTGGNSFFGIQAEARYRITPKWGAVGFMDAGHVGRSPTPLTDGDWHAGAGLGVRYDTRIGPIRLDLAVPLGEADTFKRGQVYIGIGQAF